MEKKLYCGGTILTMDPSQRGDALLVEDGRIRGIGPEAELKGQAAGAEEIRLEGRTLMPAFIDPHSHFSACANALLQGTVERAENFADIVDTIRAYIRERQIPAGSWVAVRDLDPEVLREGRVPDKGVLDLASQDHPIILQHKSGHVGVLNSLALKMAGIGADTPDPSGGKIWREDGEPTGYLEENAFIPVLHRLPPPSWEELEAAYGKAQEMYASYGIATVQEGFMSEEMIPVYRGLCGGGKLQLDVVGYPGAEGGEKLFQALPEYAGDYREHFRLGGYKMFLDGSPQSRTAWMRTPYLGSEDRGYPTLTDRQVYGYAERAVKEGRQILAHCNGDAAAEQYLAALEQVKAGGLDPAAVRPVMIHAQLLGLDQIPPGIPGGDSLLLCGPCLPLGRHPHPQFRAGAGGTDQPGPQCLGGGTPLHLPPGRPGDPAGYGGDSVVRRLPPHQIRAAAGGGGAHPRGGGAEGGDHPWGISVRGRERKRLPDAGEEGGSGDSGPEPHGGGPGRTQGDSGP